MAAFCFLAGTVPASFAAFGQKKTATPKDCGQVTTPTTRVGFQSAPFFGGVTPLR